MATGISVKTPLSRSPVDGFTLNKTLQESIKQNLRHLMLTLPGERLMDLDFGIGVKRYLFEQNTTHTHDLLRTKISEQVEKYLPFLKIVNLDIFQDKDHGNIMYVSLKYLIGPLKQTDNLDLRIKS